MSTDNTQVQAPSITRNGITKTLNDCVFGKKSDKNAGKHFFAPEVPLNRDEFSSWIDWIGFDQAVGAINKNLRLIFAQIFLDNVEDNGGVFNLEAFQAEAADFTAARVSLSDIEEQLEDLYAAQDAIVNDDNFGATVDGTEEGVKTPAALELEQKQRSISAKIRPLKLKKKSIEEEYARRAARKAANKAAKEAAAKGAVVANS